MMRYYLGLGTNLGDKEANLRTAVRLLEERVGEVASLSAFHATEPWGFESANASRRRCARPCPPWRCWSARRR